MKPQKYCVKITKNAAKGIDIAKKIQGSMPPDPPNRSGQDGN